MGLSGHFSTAVTHDGVAVQAGVRGRSAAIDLVRGLAMVLVVLGHYYPADCPAWWTTVHDAIYAFHMPVFFFAAGYIWHMRAHERYGSYFVRRIRRLLVPCASIVVLYTALKLVASMFFDLEHPVTIASMARIVTDPAHSILPFVWFFYVLFAVYAVFPIAYRWGLGVVWLSIAIAAVVYLHGGNRYLLITALGYLYFAGGTLLAQGLHLDLDRHIPTRVTELALAFGALFVFIALLWKPGYGWGGQPRYLLASVLGTATTVLCCQALIAGRGEGRRSWGPFSRPIILAFLTRIGAASMIICLFHPLFAGVANKGLDRLPLLTDLPFVGKALLCTLAGLLLPLTLESAVLSRVNILRILFLGEAGQTSKSRRFDPAVAQTRARVFQGSPPEL